jgi:hypothetical protein
MSAIMTPASNAIAALNPLIALVSSNAKNTGPIRKAINRPIGKAVRISSSIQNCVEAQR